jgi:RNase H-like domain found in reverse transcriptase
LAFVSLKTALSQAPILSLSDFTKPFVVETDTSQYGIGAVLMQNHKPNVFLSHKLGVKIRDYQHIKRNFLL